MSTLIQTYATGQALLEGLWAFLCVGKTLPAVYTGVGNGYVDDAIGTATSVFEQITLTFTSSTAFNAVGSVTGSLGSGTVGTLFTGGTVFSCTVVQGSTLWAAGDTISFTMTAPWQSKVHSPAAQYTWVAPGNDNNGGPTVSLLCSSDGAVNYFNATVVGYVNYQDTVAEAAQYKRIAPVYWTLGPAAGQTCTLYAVADGKFCYAVCVVGSTYSAACFGWMTATHNRLLHPQPMLIGGNATALATQWSSSACRGPIFSAFSSADWSIPYNYTTSYSSNRFSYAMLPPGRWAGLNGWGGENNEAYADHITVQIDRAGSRQQVNLDGTIPLTPIEIHTASRVLWATGAIFSGNWGIYPFVYTIPCYNTDGSLISGGTIFRDATSRRRYVTIQNGYVTNASNTYALELV